MEATVEMTRGKNKTTMVVGALEKHLDGECEFKASQVKAAQILLDLFLPTMTMQDVVQTVTNETANYDDMLVRLKFLLGEATVDLLLDKLSKSPDIGAGPIGEKTDQSQEMPH